MHMFAARFGAPGNLFITASLILKMKKIIYAIDFFRAKKLEVFVA